jgi:hypothetical protein
MTDQLQPQLPECPQPQPKPKGFKRILHAVGTGLKVTGETLIRIGLSGLGAVNDE